MQNSLGKQFSPLLWVREHKFVWRKLARIVSNYGRLRRLAEKATLGDCGRVINIVDANAYLVSAALDVRWRDYNKSWVAWGGIQTQIFEIMGWQPSDVAFFRGVALSKSFAKKLTELHASAK